MSKDTETPNIKNVWPGKICKVIKKPSKWEGVCRYVGQIGHCKGTSSVHGAKLKFPTGEIIHFPFECLEVMGDIKDKAIDKKPLVPEKGKSYKVIKKPIGWKSHCKFLGQTGVCVVIDDRGARLQFPSGAEISFQPDCIEESEPIDINSLSTAVKLNENSVVVGNSYRVIKKPEKFGKDADKLVGLVGKAKWVNYRGICLRFDDGSGYVFGFDEVELYIEPIKPNPVIIPKMLNASTVVPGRDYKVVKVDPDWSTYEKCNILNSLGTVKFVSDVSKGAMIHFKPSGIDKFIPFEYMEDLPRPTEEELIELIKKQPGRILKVIKGLNKITKLRPVRDFIEKGELPVVQAPEMPGPHLPIQHSEACLPQTIGEASDDMLSKVAGMFSPSIPAVTTTVDNNDRTNVEETDDGYAG